MTSRLLLLLCLIAFKEHVQSSKKLTEVITATSKINTLTEINLTTSSNDSTCASFNLYKSLFEEMNSQSHPMIQVYYNRMVQKLYDYLPANILFQQLWHIYKQCDPATFVAMVRAQLSLFWQHNMNEYPDHDYLLKAANGFYRIKNSVLYSSLNGRTQLLFERALKSLPNSLHHLFGQRDFCLMNRKYQEILYQSESDEFIANQDIRFAFTWHLTKRYHEANNKITPIFEDLNITLGEEEPNSSYTNNKANDLGFVPSTLNVALFSKYFNSFYSRWPFYDHKIGGNKTELTEFMWQQDLNLWTVQLIEDDHLVFSQNQYVMCATLFYDNKRRFVYGLKNRTGLDMECQWSAGKCDRR